MKYFSLFSGVEGFGLGFPKDWEGVGFSEIDKYASMVLKYRFPNIKNYGDITKIKWEQVPNFDMLTGGSPCQDFSIAGKRKGLQGARSSLAWEFVRCLRDKQPKYFIWENVRGVMSSRSGWDFANIISAFSQSGYSLWWQVLNAKDFGVPQNRERIFVIGFREGSPKEVFFERESNEVNYGESGNKLREQVANTIRTNYSNGFSNETYVEARFDGRDGRKTIKAGRIPEIKISPTIRAEHHNTADVHFIPEGIQVRRLMPCETEALMSWPRDWTRWGIDDKENKIEISDSQRYKMCGNGVVSNVVKEIINNLLRH